MRRGETDGETRPGALIPFASKDVQKIRMSRPALALTW